MLKTRTEKIVLVTFIILILLIPTGSFLFAQRAKQQTLSNKKYDQTVTKESSSSSKKVPNLNTLNQSNQNSGNGLNFDQGSSSAKLTFGTTLNFKINIEGRPKDSFATKLFLGIAEGTEKINPTYISTFSIDVPASGEYKGLSLLGLNQGSTYTAYLKGSAQIATASSFLATPAEVNLNLGNPIFLTTGDLNEDNVINSADYSIAKAALGATSGSPKWNANLDFNQDGVINSFDLEYITKNIGKVGAGGPWYSRPPTSSPSGSLNGGILMESSSSASSSGGLLEVF